MKRQDVEYYGVLFPDETAAKLLETAQKAARELGLDIDEFNPQKNMHITLNYLGSKTDNETVQRKIDQAIDNSELGAKIDLTVQQIGFYIANGNIQNVGLNVVMEDLEQDMGSGRTARDVAFTAKEPHITIAINPDKKVGAKAVNTNRCFWDEEKFSAERAIQEEKIANGEFNPNKNKTAIITKDASSMQYELEIPIKIAGIVSAFQHAVVVQELEDLPKSLDELLEDAGKRFTTDTQKINLANNQNIEMDK